ncbi:hypothetical protein FQZ97_1029630 [compost metagenome]
MPLGLQPQQAAGRGEVQGVVQQVGQGLAKQEALAQGAQSWCNEVLHPESGRLDTRRLGLQQFLGEIMQVHLDALFQALALLHPG